MCVFCVFPCLASLSPVPSHHRSDPEAFGAIARVFPKQILCVIIRNDTDSGLAPGPPLSGGGPLKIDSPRWENSLASLPGNKVMVFQKTRELRQLSLPVMGQYAHCGLHAGGL